MILALRAPLRIDFVTSAKPATLQTVPLIHQVLKCPKHFFFKSFKMNIILFAKLDLLDTSFTTLLLAFFKSVAV